MTAGGTALLEMSGLRIEARAGGRGPWRDVLRSVDLRLAPGEVLGVIGASGAGKSTLGLAALGHLRRGARRAGGAVRFEGQALFELAPRDLRRLRGLRIAYVAQSAAAAFNPAHRLIAQHLEAPLRGGADPREARAAAVALHARLGLPEPERFGARYPHEVSGGQLQRAMIAMAMAADPRLIVFDEPTTALDVETQLDVLAAIREATRGRAAGALYISHDLAVVSQIADRILVLEAGRAVEEGPAGEMISAPRAARTRALLAATRPARRGPGAEARGATPALALDAVTAGYRGGGDALRAVSLAAWAGATTALIGASGSGKSTAARVAAGLLRPREGAVRLDGRALAPEWRGRGRAELRAVQLIHQSPDTALNPAQTVRDIVGRPAQLLLGLRGADLDRRVDGLLERIELEPAAFRARRPDALSGGQRQRVAIARALAAEPACLICDEITSALDPLTAGGVLELIAELRRALGLAVLLITHDMGVVRATADETVVMARGRVAAAGPTERVLAEPMAPATAALASATPRAEPGWLDRALAARGLDSGAETAEGGAPPMTGDPP